MQVPEGWRETKIADIADIQVGRDLNESAYSEIKTSQYRFPVFSNTVENRGLYGFYNFEEYSGNSVTIVGRGIGLGTAFARKKGYGFGAIGRLLVVNPSNDSFDVDFFANYINFRLRIFNESGGIPQLPGSQLAKYHVVLPPLPEQQKIAQILSTWDKAIEKLEALIAAKQKCKKALMQQLLTGKKRFAGFEGEWELNFLGKVAAIVMGSSPKSEAYNEIGEGLPLLQGNADIKNRLSVPRIYTSEITKTCSPNDILLSVRAPVGAIARSLHKACIGRGIASIKAKNKCSQDFLYQWLLFFEPKWIRYCQGSTFESVNSADIKNLHINIPSIEEQQKIASVLSAADKEITTHQSQLSALKQQKKGLMQQLLIGKKRVKMEEVA